MENQNNNQNINQPIPQPPAAPKKSPTHKGLFAIIILALIAAAAITVYFIQTQPQDLGPVVIHHQIKQAQQPAATSSVQSIATSTPAQKDISNCNNYINEQYKFEFQCPQGWVTVGEPFIDSDGTALINFASPESQQGPQFDFYGGDLNVYVYNNPKGLSLTDFFSDKPGLGPNLMSDAQNGTKNITVDGQNGIRLYDVAGESTSQVAIIPNPGNNEFIEIDDSSQAVVIDQILSTFKFTQ